MRILLSACGSRGDIQPMVVLALALREAGHQVGVAIPPNFVPLARGLGIDAHPTGLDTESAWRSTRSQELLKTSNPITRARLATAMVRDGFAAFDRDLLALSADLTVDGIVTGPLGQERLYAVAQKLRVPLTTVRYCALSRNGVVGVIPSTRNIAPAVNRSQWQIADRLTWAVGGKSENTFRQRLGLEPERGHLPGRLRQRQVLQLQAYDESLFPGLSQEWGRRRPVVGFFGLTRSAKTGFGASGADTALADWLDSGSAPVYVGFGSAPLQDPAAILGHLHRAAHDLGVRMLINGLDDAEADQGSGDTIFHTRSIDHDAVLPRCRAAVHHGGAGTTAAALRAGLPSVVCWAGADQPYWGAQLTKLGLGASMRLSRLTADALTAQLIHQLTPAARAHAGRAAERLVAPEVAVESATRLIEREFAR